MGDYLVLPVTGGFSNKERIHIYIYCTIYIYLTHFFPLSISYFPQKEQKEKVKKKKINNRKRERKQVHFDDVSNAREPAILFLVVFFFFSPFGFAWQPLSTTSHCSCWCVFCPLPQLFFLLYCCCVCGNFPWHTNSIWNNSLYLSVFFFLYSSSFRSVKKKKKKSNKRELGTHTLISVWTSVANHSCWKSRGKCVWFQTKCLPLFFFPFPKNRIIFKNEQLESQWRKKFRHKTGRRLDICFSWNWKRKNE